MPFGSENQQIMAMVSVTLTPKNPTVMTISAILRLKNQAMMTVLVKPQDVIKNQLIIRRTSKFTAVFTTEADLSDMLS